MLGKNIVKINLDFGYKVFKISDNSSRIRCAFAKYQFSRSLGATTPTKILQQR